MGKKKRKKNISAFVRVEGDLEEKFFSHLEKLYIPNNPSLRITKDKGRGGSADVILQSAMRECSRAKSMAWIDEDKDISNDLRIELAKTHWGLSDQEENLILECPLSELQVCLNPENRKPTLIVSTPVCVDGFILSILGRKLKYVSFDPEKRKEQIRYMKNSFAGLKNGRTDEQFFTDELGKEFLEEMRKNIKYLDLLIDFFKT